MAQDLSGKVAAITGAASGIGLECARSAARRGRARRAGRPRRGQAAATSAAELGPQAIPLVIDLTDPAASPA